MSKRYTIVKLVDSIIVTGYEESFSFSPRQWHIAKGIAGIALADSTLDDHCFVKAVKLMRSIESIALREAKYLMRGAYNAVGYVIEEEVRIEVTDGSRTHVYTPDEYDVAMNLATMLVGKGCHSKEYGCALDVLVRQTSDSVLATLLLEAAVEITNNEAGYLV